MYRNVLSKEDEKMKKCFSCFSAVLLAMMMVVSCGKEKKAAEPAVVSESVTAPEPVEPKKVTSWSRAVSIYDKAGVFVLNDEKKLKWVGSLPKGLEVYIVCENYEMKKEQYNFVNDKEGTEKTEVANIKFGKDDNDDFYYVVASNLVEGIACAVVGDDLENGKNYTFIYSEPDITKVLSKKIPTGTIIAVRDGYVDEKDFCEATFYIPDGDSKGLYRNKYVERAAITNSKSFVMASAISARLDSVSMKEWKGNLPMEVFDNLETALEVDEYTGLLNYYLSELNLPSGGR